MQREKDRKKLGDSFQYLEGAYQQGGEWLFTLSNSDRKRGNSFKLKEGEI